MFILLPPLPTTTLAEAEAAEPQAVAPPRSSPRSTARESSRRRSSGPRPWPVAPRRCGGASSLPRSPSSTILLLCLWSPVSCSRRGRGSLAARSRASPELSVACSLRLLVLLVVLRTSRGASRSLTAHRHSRHHLLLRRRRGRRRRRRRRQFPRCSLPPRPQRSSSLLAASRALTLATPCAGSSWGAPRPRRRKGGGCSISRRH